MNGSPGNYKLLAVSQMILGEIQVDDSVIKLETVENYDISHFETTFDVALIDYQLSSSFTGILVSAWIALYLQIPRLTLTTASYPGNPAYFNGSILKNEITDSPEVVIQRILECVENYNAELWLAKQHQELVAEYQHKLMQNNIIKAGIRFLGELQVEPQLLFICAAGTPFCDHIFRLPRITFKSWHKPL